MVRAAAVPIVLDEVVRGRLGKSAASRSELLCMALVRPDATVVYGRRRAGGDARDGDLPDHTAIPPVCGGAPGTCRPAEDRGGPGTTPTRPRGVRPLLGARTRHIVDS